MLIKMRFSAGEDEDLIPHRLRGVLSLGVFCISGEQLKNFSQVLKKGIVFEIGYQYLALGPDVGI